MSNYARMLVTHSLSFESESYEPELYWIEGCKLNSVVYNCQRKCDIIAESFPWAYDVAHVMFMGWVIVPP